MALMFQRVARNFINNGYFPTDAETTQRVLNALSPCDKGSMRIVDPCCGEGVALAEAQYHLGQERTESFGIEYNEERACQAKKLLTICIHGDIQHCVVGARQFGLLWLNPPYGDLVNDSMTASNLKWKGRKRLEKLFYHRTHSYLNVGGVLVLIIPHYSLDKELSAWIARHFERVQVFKAPEQQFKQVVILGIRRRASGVASAASVKETLINVGRADRNPPDLPERWEQPPYVVPTTTQPLGNFKSVRLDAKQLQEVIMLQPCLWERFNLLFSRHTGKQRRPLKALSEWHLALALAAGEVSGVVHSNDGSKTFLIKGDTYKDKQRSSQTEMGDNGEVSEITILTDRFVPAIRALDFTTGSETYGKVFTIC